MGREYEMVWIESRKGWMKEYRKKKYAVSCRQLGMPETKIGSYQAANRWWEAKKAEIDAALRPTPPQPPRLPEPGEDILATLLGRPDGLLEKEDLNWLHFQEVREFLERHRQFEEARENPPDPE
jgi:hypothetical protein